MKLDSGKISYSSRQKKGVRAAQTLLSSSVFRRGGSSRYLQSTGNSGGVPVLKKPGRKKGSPVTDEESSLIIDAYLKYRANALYLERKIEDDSGIHINHNRIHMVLLMNSFASNSRKKWIRRKWSAMKESTQIHSGTLTGTR